MSVSFSKNEYITKLYGTGEQQLERSSVIYNPVFQGLVTAYSKLYNF